MKRFPRITLDPDVMGGKACMRGLRVTVGTVVGLLAAGRSAEEILSAYPYLEREDIGQSWPTPPGGWKNARFLFPSPDREAPGRHESVAGLGASPAEENRMGDPPG